MEIPIGELARRTGVTTRTIRYYIELGLLPPAEGLGRGAKYGQDHIDRLNEIRALRADRLTLEEIRDQLANQPAATSVKSRPEERPPSEASRIEPSALDEAHPVPAPQATTRDATSYLSRLRARRGISAGETPSRRSAHGYDAEPWFRIALSPDVELHVRRRGTGVDRHLWRLIKEAQKILEEEENR